MLRSGRVTPACSAWFCLQCRVPHLLPQKPEQVGIKFRFHFASLLSSSVIVLRTSIQRAPSVQFSLMLSATRCGATQCLYATIHYCFSFPTYKSLPQESICPSYMLLSLLAGSANCLTSLQVGHLDMSASYNITDSGILC